MCSLYNFIHMVFPHPKKKKIKPHPLYLFTHSPTQPLSLSQSLHNFIYTVLSHPNKKKINPLCLPTPALSQSLSLSVTDGEKLYPLRTHHLSLFLLLPLLLFLFSYCNDGTQHHRPATVFCRSHIAYLCSTFAGRFHVSLMWHECVWVYEACERPRRPSSARPMPPASVPVQTGQRVGVLERVADMVSDRVGLDTASVSAFMSLGGSATEEDGNIISKLLGSIGKIWKAEEKYFDAITGLSGSGPAYVYLAIEALADGGVAAGLPRDLSLSLASQTVLGAASMVTQTGKHPGQLKDDVTSPGGTTITGIHQLENGGFRGTLMNAVVAATKRSRELS